MDSLVIKYVVNGDTYRFTTKAKTFDELRSDLIRLDRTLPEKLYIYVRKSNNPDRDPEFVWVPERCYEDGKLPSHEIVTEYDEQVLYINVREIAKPMPKYIFKTLWGTDNTSTKFTISI